MSECYTELAQFLTSCNNRRVSPGSPGQCGRTDSEGIRAGVGDQVAWPTQPQTSLRSTVLDWPTPMCNPIKNCFISSPTEPTLQDLLDTEQQCGAPKMWAYFHLSEGQRVWDCSNCWQQPDLRCSYLVLLALSWSTQARSTPPWQMVRICYHTFVPFFEIRGLTLWVASNRILGLR